MTKEWIDGTPICPHCNTPIGDSEEHKLMCLGYMHSFEPWWYEPMALIFWTIVIIGVSIVINAIL